MKNPSQKTSGPSLAVQLLWIFTSIHGRIGREVYWLAWIAINCVAGFLFFSAVDLVVDPETGIAMLEQRSRIASLIPVLTLPSLVAIAAKRLHDLGASGFYAIAMLIPFANIVATILLGVMAGNAGPNRFAERADTVPPSSGPGNDN